MKHLCLFVLIIYLLHIGCCAVVKERAAGSCNGGKGDYKTYWNNNRNIDDSTRSKVSLCLQELEKKAKHNSDNNKRWGCYHYDYGQCKCTMDSSYIFYYFETFQEALQNLRKDTDVYRTVEAERYEGNMYLTYTCN